MAAIWEPPGGGTGGIRTTAATILDETTTTTITTTTTQINNSLRPEPGTPRVPRRPFTAVSSEGTKQTFMKQIYFFCLLALTMLGISLPNSANAQCTVTCNLEGALEVWSDISIYGNTPSIEKFTGTSYDLGDNTYYIVAAEGYMITKIPEEFEYLRIKIGADYHLCEGRTYVQLAAGSSDYRGQTIHFEVVKLDDISNDSKVIVQIENGGTYIQKIWLNLSNEEFTPTKDDGVEIEIPFSDSVDSELCVAPYPAYPIFSIFTVNKDGVRGEELEYDMIHGYYTIPLEDGLEVRIKVFENGTPELETDELTLVYQNQMAKDAMEMIYSRSTMLGGTLYDKTKGDPLPESLELEDGAVTTFTWNSQDYTMEIYLDDNKVSSSEFSENSLSGTTSWQFDPTGDHTITFAATEREWGAITFTFEVENEEGIIFHEGAADGPAIDLSNLTPISDIDGVKRYNVEVSLKSPKIFVSAVEGWYLLGSYYDKSEKSKIDEPAPCMLVYDGEIMHDDYKFKGHKISKTSPYVVYIEAALDNMTIKDQNDVLTDADGEVIEFQSGYNLIYVDPVYSSVINVIPYNDATFSVFYDNDQTISADADSGTFTAPCDANGVLHIYSSAPTKRTVSFNIPDNTTKVTYHMVKEHDTTATKTALTTFHNTQISITPREGCSVYLDGEKLEPQAKTRAYEAALAEHTLTFTVTKDDHSIEVKYEGNATDSEVTPADNTSLPEITYVLVSFPNASEVKVAPSASSFDIKMTSADGTTWKGTLTENEATSSDVPTFKYSIANPPTEKGEYKITISGGHYIVDGDLQSKPITATYAIDLESGVAEIISGSIENASIFTIDGRLLVKKADKNALDSLEKGIYIINGKKVIKK